IFFFTSDGQYRPWTPDALQVPLSQRWVLSERNFRRAPPSTRPNVIESINGRRGPTCATFDICPTNDHSSLPAAATAGRKRTYKSKSSGRQFLQKMFAEIFFVKSFGLSAWLNAYS